MDTTTDDPVRPDQPMLHNVTTSSTACHTASAASRRAFLRVVLSSPALLGLARADAGSARLLPLAADLWWLAAHEGDADAANRGVVSNVLLAPHQGSLWLLGSGPSPAFGRALLREIRRRWPLQSLELISTWAHPESVLGVSGMPQARHRAHTEVAQQMQQRCPGCLQRLAARMGEASADLEVSAASTPIRIPGLQFTGSSGRLGPFEWHRRRRAADVTVTVWRHRASGLVHAPGLIWGDAPPDGRDADVFDLAAELADLLNWGRQAGVQRWLGQQGREVGTPMVESAAAYWRLLTERAMQGQDSGDDGHRPPEDLPGVPPHWLTHPLHGLNWQRSWRQAESRWLQRSLR